MSKIKKRIKKNINTRYSFQRFCIWYIRLKNRASSFDSRLKTLYYNSGVNTVLAQTIEYVSAQTRVYSNDVQQTFTSRQTEYNRIFYDLKIIIFNISVENNQILLLTNFVDREIKLMQSSAILSTSYFSNEPVSNRLLLVMLFFKLACWYLICQ